MSFSTTLTVEVSRAFFVDTPTVDLLNVGPSISPKVVEVLVEQKRPGGLLYASR